MLKSNGREISVNDAKFVNGTQEMDINLPSSALEQYAAGMMKQVSNLYDSPM